MRGERLDDGSGSGGVHHGIEVSTSNKEWKFLDPVRPAINIHIHPIILLTVCPYINGLENTV